MWRRVEWPNDPSSATRPASASDCNLDAMAGFAAAHVSPLLRVPVEATAGRAGNR
jgi:hypothetical protein